MKYNFYKNDGTVHYAGIRNELTVLAWLKAEYAKKQNPLLLDDQLIKNGNDLHFQNFGSTKHKEDIKLTIKNHVFTISVKEHKIKRTFDLINTSKINAILKNQHNLKQFNDFLNIFKQQYQNITKAEYACNKSQIKKPLFQAINQFIVHNIKQDELKTLLAMAYQKTCDYLIIKEYNGKQTIYIIAKEQRADFKIFINKKAFFHLDPRALKKGKNSASIFHNEAKTYLRFRCVLNNGFSPLLNLSKANKSSQLSFKIQVDSVKQLVEHSKATKFNL